VTILENFSRDFDWTAIDTVLLDMDGTLLDLHFDNAYWLQHMPIAYGKLNGLSYEQALDKIRPIFEREAGTLNWYSVDFWNAELGLDVVAGSRKLSHKIAYRPRAREFLSACKHNCDDIRLVTNAHRATLDMKIEFTQIDRYFHQMLCSHELNHAKEDQRFWQNLHIHTQYDPERTLFIDDNDAVLNSAHEYGIKHLYSIAKPDSVTPRGAPSRFAMIKSF